MIQRGLVAAVSLVLALIIITAFRGLLEPPDETTPLRTTTTEALAANDDDDITTTTTEPGSTTTSTTGPETTPAICFEDEPEDTEATIVRVYYACGSTDIATGGTWVYRAVEPTDLVLTTTMAEMVKGLDDGEEALGFKSPFPASAEGSSRGVSIVDGTAFIEFDDGLFPDGADTAEGSQVFLSTLNANAFQFPSIDAVEYRLRGSCDAFWQRLGAEGCETITRSEWEAQVAAG
jgi:hypothetical protein